MKKSCYVLFFLLFSPGILFAQLPDETMKKAKDILNDIMYAKGEKVYEEMNNEMKAAVSAPQINTLWMSFIMQCGAFKEVTHWEGAMKGNNQVVTARLVFEKQSLVYVASFYDGKMNGLWFQPAPQAKKDYERGERNDVFADCDITVTTGKFKLPGFLTRPVQGENLPCVILVHGSGPTDRDETILDNHPFRDLAHGLAKQGIAVIRYDKRTFVYGSDFMEEGQEATTKNEVTDDVVSAVKLAGTMDGIDSTRIFVLGHSLGAMLAPRIATLIPGLKGIIMMAGNARPLDELVVEQVTYLNGINPSTGWEKHLDELKTQITNMKKLGTSGFDKTVKLPLGMPASYWEDLNGYHQTEVAKSLVCPVLILNGEADYQVPLTDYQIWRKELGNQKNVAFKSYPGLSHLFMEVSGKPSPKDYEVPRHIPGYVIADIANWINQQK